MSLFDRGAVRAPQVFRRDGERVQSPFEDVPGGVHVGVRRVRAFLADEDRLALAVLLVHMPASAACLARVGGVDEYHAHAFGEFGLIGEHGRESSHARLSQAPVESAFRGLPVG